MKESEVKSLYQKWCDDNNGQKPNRAVVKMAWEDGDNTEKGWQEDVIALDGQDAPDDDCILFYASGLEGLLELMKPDNGSDFIVLEVIEFYCQQ